MTMTVPSPIAHAVQQTQEWLKELRDNGGLASESEAYAVLRAVLHQLRDRLTLAEAVDLGQQLPLIVRGIYSEGWRPSHAPEQLRPQPEFLDHIARRLLPGQVPPEPAVGDVFALFARHTDPGEIADVIEHLPAESKGLRPETARTFRARAG